MNWFSFWNAIVIAIIDLKVSLIVLSTLFWYSIWQYTLNSKSTFDRFKIEPLQGFWQYTHSLVCLIRESKFINYSRHNESVIAIDLIIYNQQYQNEAETTTEALIFQMPVE